MHILVAEDEVKTADMLGRALESEGHSVLHAYHGQDALALGRSGVDLIMLDIMLPRLDGFSVLSKLREEKRRTAVIIVSGRDAPEDIVRGLDSGADDYLTKPFVLDVLQAKVRAVARRAAKVHPSDLAFADLTLIPRTYEVQRGDRVVALTRTEYALLETMMRRAGSIVPRDVLIEEAWGLDSDVNGSSLYVFIRALRSKITQPGESELLHTVRGIGYILRSGSR
jgi:DNA-binding response OmpR family regulator